MSRTKFIILFIFAIILLGITVIIVVSPGKSTSPQNENQTEQSFFPLFGNRRPQPNEGDVPTPQEGETTGGQTGGGVNTTTDPLFRITTIPVAGALSFTKEVLNADGETEDSNWVRYVARENGFIYEKEISNLSFEKKISTTTIPRVEEALFLNKGKTVALRYLGDDFETIKTFMGSVPQETTGGDGPSVLRGSFLPENIIEFSKSTLGNYFFYLSPSSESAVGTLTNSDTNQKNQFFNSLFKEWTTHISNNGAFVFITTKPSTIFRGYSYRLTVPSNNPVRILGGILGLTINPSPLGSKILYSDNTLALGEYNVSTKTSTALGIKTLPEKCVWSGDNITIYCLVPNTIPNTNYPDDWYNGSTSFIDSLWKINTETSTAIFIENISAKNRGMFDGTKPILSEDDSLLFFTNKNDGTLWGYRLNE